MPCDGLATLLGCFSAFPPMTTRKDSITTQHHFHFIIYYHVFIMIYIYIFRFKLKLHSELLPHNHHFISNLIMYKSSTTETVTLIYTDCIVHTCFLWKAPFPTATQSANSASITRESCRTASWFYPIFKKWHMNKKLLFGLFVYNRLCWPACTCLPVLPLCSGFVVLMICDWTADP